MPTVTEMLRIAILVNTAVIGMRLALAFTEYRGKKSFLFALDCLLSNRPKTTWHVVISVLLGFLCSAMLSAFFRQTKHWDWLAGLFVASCTIIVLLPQLFITNWNRINRSA